MQILARPSNERAHVLNQRVEAYVNRLLRGFDRQRAVLGLGGRKGYYNDDTYEFEGGARDALRAKHYDKSLRLLWKAQEHAPWMSFRDCTQDEMHLLAMAEKSLTPAEKAARKRVNTQAFRDQLNSLYTPRQKQAIVNILAMIGHGEAYAWMVSSELLNEVRSTGGRAAMTMQVLEEAKHFVVLRELLQAFDCPIPRMNAWEYLLLERTYKSEGLEKFFGMNVVVEGFALSLFGMMGALPGLEILKLFHRDESRHTALPSNYLHEFPLSWWDKNNPAKRLHRLSLVLPALPIFMLIEADLAEIGIDSFDFGGSLARKILKLSDRVGFKLPLTQAQATRLFNTLFNAYCRATRSDYVHKDFLSAETTTGQEELDIEAEVFMLKTA